MVINRMDFCFLCWFVLFQDYFCTPRDHYELSDNCSKTSMCWGSKDLVQLNDC